MDDGARGEYNITQKERLERRRWEGMAGIDAVPNNVEDDVDLSTIYHHAQYHTEWMYEVLKQILGGTIRLEERQIIFERPVLLVSENNLRFGFERGRECLWYVLH